MEQRGRDSLSSSRSLLMALGCTDIAARAALCVSPWPILVVHVSLCINISVVSRRVSAEDARDTASGRGMCSLSLSLSLSLARSLTQLHILVDEPSVRESKLLSNDDVALDSMHSKCRHAFKLVSPLERPKGCVNLRDALKEPRSALSAFKYSENQENIQLSRGRCLRSACHRSGSPATRTRKG